MHYNTWLVLLLVSLLCLTETVDGGEFDKNTLVIMSKGRARPRVHLADRSTEMPDINWISINLWE